MCTVIGLFQETFQSGLPEQVPRNVWVDSLEQIELSAGETGIHELPVNHFECQKERKSKKGPSRRTTDQPRQRP
jgi:hypothetical protein